MRLFLDLFIHHFKEFFRARQWGNSLTIKIFSLLGFIIVALELVAAGWFSPFLIEKLNTGKSVSDTFSGYVLFYFFLEFFSRFLLQNLPALKIQPYLHLNIPRSQLVHFLLLKSLFSYFNLFFLLIAVPFGIKGILLEGHLLWFTGWIFTVLLAVSLVNFLALLVKRTFGLHWKSTLVTLLIIILMITAHVLKWIDFQAVSVVIFNSGIWSVLLLAVLLVLVYGLNYRLQIDNIYIKEASVSGGAGSFADKLLSRFTPNSVEAELVMTELKLLFRNKRPKATMIIIPIFLVMGFVMPQSQYSMYDVRIQFLITAVVMLPLNYGSMLPAWESTYFDGLMTRNISFKTYLLAKYYVLMILSLAGVVPLLFTLFSGVEVFIGGVCVLLYVAGVNTIAYLGLSNKNHKRLEINESSWFNNNMNSGGAFGWLFLVGIIPVVIYLPFMLFKWYFYGALFLGFLGLLGFLFHRQFIKEFDEKYKETKYQMLEGFRTK